MSITVEMKRSAPGIMYVTPHDFNLVKNGGKTATSRLGDRTTTWPVGTQLELVNNQDESQRVKIEVVECFLTTLKEITDEQALAIGGYTVEDHKADFTSVYDGSDEDTELSYVGFRVI